MGKDAQPEGSFPTRSTRFKKGQSGNPAGRPRKSKQGPSSELDLVVDRTFLVTDGDVRRELKIEEALQQKTFMSAMAGNRSATREVLKWIRKREEQIAAARPEAETGVEFIMEPEDPANAEQALLILGIAAIDPAWPDASGDERRLLLEPWAVQAALSRRGRKPLDAKEVAEVERCTRSGEDLTWPRGGKR